MSNKNKIKVKKPKSKIQNAIKIVILILIVVIVAFIIYLRISKKNSEKPNFEDKSDFIREYVEDKIIPQHIYDFSTEYKGNVERNEIYKQLYKISKFLPDLCFDLKKIEAKKYYSEFSKQVKENLGIETEEEFLKLSDFLSKNDISELNFEYCGYNAGSLVQENKYSNITMYFKYENIDEITLNIGILNRYRADKTPLKIIMK